METTPTKRLTSSEVDKLYDGRWVLMTNFVRDPETYEWFSGVVIADTPPDNNAPLFHLAKKLDLKEAGIFFIGENPYCRNFLL